MLKKLLLTSIITSSLLFSANIVTPNLSNELKRNERIIQEYEKAIVQLKERNAFLQEQKKKNPKLHEEKALFEETKSAYIQRIELEGTAPKNIDFKLANHRLSLKMQIETTRDNKDGFYQGTRSFFQEYSIPMDVEESKITYKQEGDYFVITMPKRSL